MQLQQLSLEESMPKQKRLPLSEENSLEALWEQLSEGSREEVINLYARLIAAGLRQEEFSSEEEVSHEQFAR
jgi:hypothetical protein